jgi:hypothetical protein
MKTLLLAAALLLAEGEVKEPTCHINWHNLITGERGSFGGMTWFEAQDQAEMLNRRMPSIRHTPSCRGDLEI